MSQNGVAPTTDENRPPMKPPHPIPVPMLPLMFPYGSGSVVGQQYYHPNAVYPSVALYPSNVVHPSVNYGLGAPPHYYASYYPAQTGMLPPRAHIPTAAMLPSGVPLMARSYATTKASSATQSPVMENEGERNKNLNIRECHSPVLNERAEKKKQPLLAIQPGDEGVAGRLRTASSSSPSPSLVSYPELEQNPPSILPPDSIPLVQEVDSEQPPDDFLTFIAQKTRATTSKMPELNPLASEFSFGNSKTLPTSSPDTPDTVSHVSSSHDNQSSYRLLFDNLIEKSLESMEALKKSTKKVSTTDASVECHQITDCINRSTQTTEQTNHGDLITDYSLRTIKLMDTLLANFRSIYSGDYHEDCKAMAQTCDELHHLLVFVHRLASSLADPREAPRSQSIDLSNPFSNAVRDLAALASERPTSSLGVGRGSRRLTSSTSHSPIPSFSCRQFNPTATTKPKVCSLCYEPLGEQDNAMHKLCWSLAGHLDT